MSNGQWAIIAAAVLLVVWALSIALAVWIVRTGVEPLLKELQLHSRWLKQVDSRLVQLERTTADGALAVVENSQARPSLRR